MKLASILVLTVTMNLVKRNTAINDNSSVSKTAVSNRLIEITNKTNTQSERHGKITTINNRKTFLVTRKPPINIYRRKHRRIKKPLITKIQNKRLISAHIMKPSKISLKSYNFRKPRIAITKYIDKTNINQYMRNFFQKTINNADISDEYEDITEELKENTAIVCMGPEIKSIVAQVGRIAIKEQRFQNIHKLKDLLKIRECLLKFKRLEHEVLFNKSKNKDIKLSEALQRKLFGRNNADSTAKTDSSEMILNFINDLKQKFNEGITNDKSATTQNIIHDSRSKRSVNIIEEEGVATTSSAFKFTGRDLSVHSGFIYRNIHN